MNNVLEKNICDYLFRQTKSVVHRPALIYKKRAFSYLELSQQVSKCSKALIAQGTNQGDKVAVLCSTRPEYWITFLAATSIGAIWLGLNPKYKLPEIRYVLEDAKPKLLFALANFEQHDYSDTIATIQSDYDFIEQVISLTDVLPNTQSFDDFLATGDTIDDATLRARQNAVDTL